MENQYRAPESELGLENSLPLSRFKITVFTAFLIVAYEVLAWNLIPYINEVFANLVDIEGVGNFTLVMIFDILNSFVLLSIIAVIFILFTKKNALIFTLSYAVIGFFIFFIELGGFDCIGKCGLPLWYDLFGFAKYPAFAIIVGYAVNSIFKTEKSKI